MLFPKISIIIPIYNAEPYLKQCIDSILNQTLKDIEVICIDDGSTDNSFRILQQYEKNDPRIVIHKQPNRGAGAARNTGLAIAQGEYLSIVDADDFFEPCMLEIAYKQCEKNHADFCVFRSDEYDDKTCHYLDSLWTIEQKYLPEKNPFSAQNVTKYAFQLFNGWAWDKLYRRSFVEHNQLSFQEIRTTNDAFFVFLSTLQAKRITVINEILVHHRINVSTSLTVTREKSWECGWKALELIKKELKKRKQYEMYKQSYLNFAMSFLLWNYYTLQGDEKERYRKMMAEIYFPSLEFEKYPQQYFYAPIEYQHYLDIKKGKSIQFNLSSRVRYYYRAYGFFKTIVKVIKYIIKNLSICEMN